MFDLLIRQNDDTSFFSLGWPDRPMQALLLAVHASFADVREIEIVRFVPK